MRDSSWVPEEVLLDRPNVARLWEYFLGGGHNFAIDREAAERVIGLYPDLPLVAQVTRAFLGRVVRYLLSQGIDQFLDVGAGIPTASSVHEIAQRQSESARVVYVDNDPVAVAHSQAILRGTDNALAIQADARNPEEIVSHPEAQRILDWSRPIGILAIAMLHFVPEDDEALRIVRVLRDATVSGSYLAITHAAYDSVEQGAVGEVERVYDRTSAPFHFRSESGIRRLFENYEVIEPGVVYVPLWRPETQEDLLLDQPARTSAYAGLGRMP